MVLPSCCRRCSPTHAGAGVDARWAVINGDRRFFEITKRIHNHLYGTPGDGGPLGAAERRDYEETARRNAEGLAAMVQPGDIVVLHDPQTAGARARAAPRRVPRRLALPRRYRPPNAHSESAWDFLRPYLGEVEGYVFSCARFAPDWVPRERLAVDRAVDRSVLGQERADPAPRRRRGCCSKSACSPAVGEPSREFTRRDGTRGRVGGSVDLVGTGPPPPPDVPVVLQASRWDALKDMPGVMRGFAERLAEASATRI